MQAARICHAASSRLVQPALPRMLFSQLRRYSTFEAARAPRTIETPVVLHDHKSRPCDREFFDAFCAAFYPSDHAEQQPWEPTGVQQPYTRHSTPSGQPLMPSTSAELLNSYSSLATSSPLEDHDSPRTRPLENQKYSPRTRPSEGQKSLWTRPGHLPESPHQSRANSRSRQHVSVVIRNFQPGSMRKPPMDASPEAWHRWRVRQSLYYQWGFIRQHTPPSELLAARRAFKSWKIKLSHVLDPVDPSTWQWLGQGRWLFELDTTPSMREAWGRRGHETRMREWPLTLLSTMHLYPDKAGMVLDATLEPGLPGYAIHDVLLFAVQRFRLEPSLSVQERTNKADEMLDLASRIVEDLPARYVPFGQRTFGLLASKLPCEQADELFTLLSRNGCKLHANTLLHFASKLAEEDAYKTRAFEILTRLADDGMDLNDARLANIVTTLLHLKAPHGRGVGEDESQSFSPTEALHCLVERGFSPTADHATVFLESLCRQNEVEEALRLALLFTECGTQLDTRSWAAVFRGAKSSLDVGNIVEALDLAKTANVPEVNVLNNLLHAIFCFAHAESREWRRPPPWNTPLFIPMLRVYAKRFHLEPLQWWLPDELADALAQDTFPPHLAVPDDDDHVWNFPHSVLPVADEFFSAAQSLLQPDMTTIAIMLRSYIRSLRSPHDLMSYYSFFKARLEEEGGTGHQGRALVENQGSLMHDAFILAMSEHALLAREALRVFGDMLKEHSATNSAKGGSDIATDATRAQMAPIQPFPTVFTFTILLRGLMSRGEHIFADQILQFMDELGVKANLVTWNTLIKGYALLQDVDQTVATLHDMEAAGFHPDALTFKAFSKLRDQGNALQKLQRILNENEQTLIPQPPMPLQA